MTIDNLYQLIEKSELSTTEVNALLADHATESDPTKQPTSRRSMSVGASKRLGR